MPVPYKVGNTPRVIAAVLATAAFGWGASSAGGSLGDDGSTEMRSPEASADDATTSPHEDATVDDASDGMASSSDDAGDDGASDATGTPPGDGGVSDAAPDGMTAPLDDAGISDAASDGTSSPVDSGVDASGIDASSIDASGADASDAATCPGTETSCTADGGVAQCTDTTSDPANCGQCGTACALGQTCSAGTCSPVVCGTAGENGNITLTCPAGSLITDVTYASYGTPTGTCPGPFTNGACNGTNSLSVVKTLCQGQSSCSFTADNTTFTDPCVGTVKNMAVTAVCGPALGATCPAGTVYQEPWLTDPLVSGSWTNIVGTETYNASTDSESLATGNPNTQMWIGTRAAWTNYTISVPVRLDAGSGNGGLNFRMQSVGTGNDSGQMYYAGISSGGVYLGMENNGWSQFGSSPATFATGTFYTLQVVASGSTLSVSVNGANTVTATDSTFGFGSIGLRTFVAGMTYGPVTVTCN